MIPDILFAVSSDISLWIPVNLFILPGLLKLHSWLNNITIKCIPNCHSMFLTCKHSHCMSVILIQGLWFTKHAWLAKTWSEDLSGGKCLVNMNKTLLRISIAVQTGNTSNFVMVLCCMIYITYFPLLPVADCFPIELLVSCSHDCFYCTLKLLTYHAGSCMCTYFYFEHNRTPSGQKMMTGVQVVSQVQIIGCRWQVISSWP